MCTIIQTPPTRSRYPQRQPDFDKLMRGWTTSKALKRQTQGLDYLSVPGFSTAPILYPSLVQTASKYHEGPIQRPLLCFFAAGRSAPNMFLRLPKTLLETGGKSSPPTNNYQKKTLFVEVLQCLRSLQLHISYIRNVQKQGPQRPHKRKDPTF